MSVGINIGGDVMRQIGVYINKKWTTPMGISDIECIKWEACKGINKDSKDLKFGLKQSQYIVTGSVYTTQN